jgi:hypothetical protein
MPKNLWGGLEQAREMQGFLKNPTRLYENFGDGLQLLITQRLLVTVWAEADNLSITVTSLDSPLTGCGWSAGLARSECGCRPEEALVVGRGQ